MLIDARRAANLANTFPHKKGSSRSGSFSAVKRRLAYQLRILAGKLRSQNSRSTRQNELLVLLLLLLLLLRIESASTRAFMVAGLLCSFTSASSLDLRPETAGRIVKSKINIGAVSGTLMLYDTRRTIAASAPKTAAARHDDVRRIFDATLLTFSAAFIACRAVRWP